MCDSASQREERNPEEGSGDMLIGLTRTRDRFESRSVFSLVPLHRSSVASGWHTDRGSIRFEASCDLFGGFPGFAQMGGTHHGAQLRISDHFLLIDDGKSGGFGLPISWLEGAVLLPLPGRDELGLRMFYRDGPCPRVFTIRFRGGLLSMRAHRRAEHSLNVLTSLGMNDKFADEAPAEPDFRVPWAETRQFETENVVWTGATTGPLHVGLDSAPTDVWLTTKSLIWGGPGGEGINRVPLQLLQDVITAQVDDRARTPAVYISFGDESTGRFDLAFLFDRYDTERNVRERGAFLVGLRSRGIPLGSSVPRYQPWKITAYPVSPQPALPQDTDELPTMERPLRKGRRLGINHVAPRGTNRLDEMEWDGYDDEQEGLEFIDVADPVWPESHVSVPYLRIVDEAYEGPFSDPAATGFWDGDDLTWEREVEVSTAEEERPVNFRADTQVVESVDEVPTTPEEAIVLEQTAEFELAKEPETDTMLSEFADPGENSLEIVEPVFVGDYQLAAEWTFEATQTEDFQDPTSAEPETGRLAATTFPIEDGMAAIKQYETSSLAVLGEVLKAIADRAEGGPITPLTEPMPTPALQASALGALIELTATGAFDMEEARRRKSRIIGLGESGTRLRSLLELRDAGHISDEVLEQKKSAITAQLSTLIHPKS
jgi:hypothetical protein